MAFLLNLINVGLQELVLLLELSYLLFHLYHGFVGDIISLGRVRLRNISFFSRLQLLVELSNLILHRRNSSFEPILLVLELFDDFHGAL